MDAIDLIAAERDRQMEKGYDAAHDDGQENGQLAHKSQYYLSLDNPNPQHQAQPADHYPYGEERPKLRNRLDHAIRAGALAAAEVDRLLRLGLTQTVEEPDNETDTDEEDSTAETKGTDEKSPVVA